jgi:hypothetical protein
MEKIMDMTIKSRKLGQEFSFFMPDNGGYVRLESAGHPGTLGKQICYGGNFAGMTVHASPATFKKECHRWYANYIKDAQPEKEYPPCTPEEIARYDAEFEKIKLGYPRYDAEWEAEMIEEGARWNARRELVR